MVMVSEAAAAVVAVEVSRKGRRRKDDGMYMVAARVADSIQPQLADRNTTTLAELQTGGSCCEVAERSGHLVTWR